MRINKLIAVLFICLTILSGCSSTKYEEDTWTIVKEKAFSFSDEEYVDLWRPDFGIQNVYKLANGTILLRVQDSIGPADVYVGGVECFDDLGETAQNAILAYYEEQGLHYDIQMELEKAYAEYLSYLKTGENFNSFFVSQDISPTVSNERIMYFLTSVMLTVGGQEVQEIQIGTAFNRDTGKKVDTLDLFSLSENKALKQLVILSQITDADLLVEMEAVIKPQYIIFFQDSLEIRFPQGTLSGEEYSLGYVIEYEDLKDVLHSWAIPYSSQ
jgi:hypothetical protein